MSAADNVLTSPILGGIACNSCKKVGTLLVRRLEYRGAYEYEVYCQSCGYRIHSYYSDAELEQMSKEIALASGLDRKRLLKAYRIKFYTLQAQMAPLGFLYCKRHDLAYCSRHVSGSVCIDEGCHLIVKADAKFCSVCDGIVKGTLEK